METPDRVFALVLVLLILGLIGWYEFYLWRECLSDHSFFYCFRVLAP